MTGTFSAATRRQVLAWLERVQGEMAEMHALLAANPREPESEDAARAAQLLPCWFSAFGPELVTVAQVRGVRPDTALGAALAAWSDEEHEGNAGRTGQALGILLRTLSQCGPVAGFVVESAGREGGATVWRVSPSPPEVP